MADWLRCDRPRDAVLRAWTRRIYRNCSETDARNGVIAWRVDTCNLEVAIRLFNDNPARMTFVDRPRLIRALQTALNLSPVVGLIGPRQAGKTTLARILAGAEKVANYFDLEDPDDLLALENPKSTLGGLQGLVIIDEVQRRPELFPVLRVLVDRPSQPARFFVVGSASPALLRQRSETLAGRVEYVDGTWTC